MLIGLWVSCLECVSQRAVVIGDLVVVAGVENLSLSEEGSVSLNAVCQ